MSAAVPPAVPAADPPSLATVRALPCVLDAVVDPTHVDDVFAHLTVTGHLALHAAASAAVLARLGIAPTPDARAGSGAMDLEHHLRYLGEVALGAEVAVYERLLGRAGRTFHGVRYLVDRTGGQVASSFEFVSVHVDLATRRAAPFPPAVAARLDEAVAAGATHTEAVPRCTTLGLR